MKKTKLLSFVAVVFLLLSSFMTLAAFATTVQTFTLPSFSATYLQYLLPQGTAFSGSISTTGSVRFFVSDPNGSQIVNLGIVDKNATFSFHALQSGNYTLNFENELPNSIISVTFSYVANPAIPGTNSSTGISLGYLLTTIEVIAALAVFLAIFLVRRRQSKIRTTVFS